MSHGVPRTVAPVTGLLLVVVLLTCSTYPVAAQERPEPRFPVHDGNAGRVTTGAVARRMADPQTVAWDSVQSTAKGRALIGGVAGATAGFLFFHFALAPDWENDFNRGYGPSTAWGYVIYAVPAAAVGALIGVWSAS